MAHADGPSQDDERALLDEIGKWLTRDVEPNVMRMEHADEYPIAFIERMKEFGLFGATISPEFGGLGLSTAGYARIVARISETWMSLTGFFNTHLLMSRIVEMHGTEHQKRYWLPRFASGEIRGAIGLTEPGGGTDLQSIRTRAKKIGNDRYAISGSKTWITNGVEGGAVGLLVKTDPEAEPRHRGMSMFIAPKADPETGIAYKGFRTGRKLPKLGYKGIDSGELFFEDYELDAERHLVGGIEGRGFHMAMSSLELGRINVAARGVGVARRALTEALAYAQGRETFGKPIAEHQAIQLKLAEMATRVRASELLVEDAAAAFDAGRRSDMEAGMAKYFATEAALENAIEAMRIHGGYGYSRDFPVERLYRDAPLLCIGEGTNEMQRIVIARQLVARNPA
ncbi:MAG: acyl-CoA dehydrogenase family protein [Alphaproteobacteria bacterium]|nr:acyl-CoA dehydrogenase family protein [Alphaproteobacteria bacterium]